MVEAEVSGRRGRRARPLRRIVSRLLSRAELLRFERERPALARGACRGARAGGLDARRDRRRASGVRQRLRGALMPTPIDRDELQALLADDGQLIDVLPAAEYKEE